MSETETATSKILAAALPGVGPSTGARLAEHFGSSFEEVMDSPSAVSQLVEVKKIGLKTATKIKKAWDATRGNTACLAYHGNTNLPLPVAACLFSRFEPHPECLLADNHAGAA